MFLVIAVIVVVITAAFFTTAIALCVLVVAVEKLDSCAFHIAASAVITQSEVWIARKLK